MYRTLILLLVLTVGLQATADAQRPNTRDGFWIGFGLGAGWLGFNGDVDSDSREIGGSGYLRMGGSLSQKVLIGGEITGWGKEVDGENVSVGFLGAVILFYPKSTGSFYLKGGLGVLGYDEGPFGGAGFSITLGLGNEFRVGNNFSIVLFANAVGSTGVEVKVDGVGTGVNIDPSILQMGVGVGWH